MKKLFIVVVCLIQLCVVVYIWDLFRPNRDDGQIRYARAVGAPRWQRLYADCQSLANGRPFSVKPYPDGEYTRMWDEKDGYPYEFADFHPIRAYVSKNSVQLMIGKNVDQEEIIEVTGLQNGQPMIELIQRNDRESAKEVLWKTVPNQSPDRMPGTNAPGESGGS